MVCIARNRIISKTFNDSQNGFSGKNFSLFESFWFQQAFKLGQKLSSGKSLLINAIVYQNRHNSCQSSIDDDTSGDKIECYFIGRMSEDVLPSVKPEIPLCVIWNWGQIRKAIDLRAKGFSTPRSPIRIFAYLNISDENISGYFKTWDPL